MHRRESFSTCLMDSLHLVRLAKGINRSVASELQQPSWHSGDWSDGRVTAYDLSMMAVLVWVWMERRGTVRDPRGVRL